MTATETPDGGMFTGHPQGLFRLFFIEMWERLAFYTMLNVLLLYATDFEREGLGLSSADGNQIYGLYLAFVYFTPFLGGMIAGPFVALYNGVNHDVTVFRNFRVYWAEFNQVFRPFEMLDRQS